MEDPLSKLLVVLFFVFLNGFFVAAEFAIVTAPVMKIEEMAAGGHRRARVARYILKHLDAYLSGCQVGITLASLALGWIGEPFLARLIEPLLHGAGVQSAAVLHTVSFIIAFSTITFLHIVVGEMAPKSYAIRKSLRVTLLAAFPLHAFYVVFYPFIAFTNGAAMLLLRLIGLPSDPVLHVHSEAEIRALFNRSAASGELTVDETQMMEKVLDFHDREAHQVMVPRPDVIFLSVESDAEANIKVAEKCGYTRFPLCDGDVDRVLGFVHVKDLYRAVREANGNPVDLRKLKRSILFFPEHTPLQTILREFQARRVHLGIVLDEYGGTLGMLTLEDVIEELVGEIQDEFDREMPPVRRVGPTQFVVDGGCAVSDFEEATGVELPVTGADTVAGVILDTAGDLPEEGDRVPVPGGTLVVEEVQDRRVTRLRFLKKGPDSPPELPRKE